MMILESISGFDKFYISYHLVSPRMEGKQNVVTNIIQGKKYRIALNAVFDFADMLETSINGRILSKVQKVRAKQHPTMRLSKTNIQTWFFTSSTSDMTE